MLFALASIAAPGCVVEGDISLGNDDTGIGGAPEPEAGAPGDMPAHSAGGSGGAQAGSGSQAGDSAHGGAAVASGGTHGSAGTSAMNASGGMEPTNGAGAPGDDAGGAPSDGTGGTRPIGGIGGSAPMAGIGGTAPVAGSGAVGPAAAPPSCADFRGLECQGDDCCKVLRVPGGTRVIDGTERTIRTFDLDKYEVTVRRFRAFQEAAATWEADGNPLEGAGAHPDVPESGFRKAWVDMVDDAVAVGLTVKWLGYPENWGSTPDSYILGGNPDYVIEYADELAVNWVPFHLAFAFCIWDGGRLPSKAEWLYAALGGDTPTRYPWGDMPGSGEMFANSPEPSVETPYPDDPYWNWIAIPVGSHPTSAGRFGHQDLAAGLGEFVRDTYLPEGDPNTTTGLIELFDDEDISELLNYKRGRVGGDWSGPGVTSLNAVHAAGSGMVGFRCVRDVP